MGQPITPTEQYGDLRFPARGIDLGVGFVDQRNGTTPVAENVRAYDPFTQRLRGGSRPGLVRYIDDALPGELQDLNAVILPSAEAQGISFDDVPILDAQFQLEDPIVPTFFLADGTVNWILVGGSGFYTPKEYTRRNSPVILSITPDSGDFAGGELLTIIGDRMGGTGSRFYFGDRTAHVLTNDGDTATVIAPEQDEQDGPLTVDVYVDTGVARSQVTDDTRYTYGDSFVQGKYSEVYADGVNVVVLDDAVTTGDLLVVAFYAFGPVLLTGAMTDSLGNIYTKADSIQLAEPQVPTSYANISLEIWYTVSDFTGACTVTGTFAFNPIDGAPLTPMAVLEFRGTALVSPVDVTDTNSANDPIGAGVSMTVGNLVLTLPGEVVVGCFATVGISPTSIAAANGFTLFSTGELTGVVYKTGANVSAEPQITFDNAVTPDAATQYAAVGVAFKRAV